DEYHNAVYFRNLGSLEGWNYYCGDPTVLETIDKELRWAHACSYVGCGEKLSEEDTSRPRWIAIIEYADGSKFELIDYLDREHDYRNKPFTNTERVLRHVSETVFGAEIERIGTLSPEELGEHTRTTYNADGTPSRKINYSGDGTVLNGYDYNDPMKDF
ncbi:MAG: hypothetical protein K6G79_05065, partial [Bacteroidales bacterium]|nr:hypothetical protein [Bacteroidales bacterium]